MPTVSGGTPEEVSSQDEIKVFKYEGEEEESEKSSSESLLKEDKSSLITETEEKSGGIHIPSSSYAGGSKFEGRLPDTSPFGLFGASAWGPDRLGYLSPFAYAYTNGSTVMAAKEMGLGPCSPGSSLFSLYHNGQGHLGQPPPAHMGISPYQLDPKTEYNVSVAGLRPHVYPFPTSGQYPYPLSASDFTAQMATAWFSPGGLIHPHPGLTPPLSHHLIHSPKTELPLSSQETLRHDSKNNLSSSEKSQMIDSKNGDKKPHIKKPLNAFMLYMKEMRAKVVAECTLKESAAINQILGRKWHALTRDEQAKYYEMARKERQLHMQMYPGWSSRQNYSHGKKKKRNRDKSQDGANMKKCRARYGLEQQSQWCKPCRRKKKCVRYMEGEPGDSEDHSLPGSIGSQDMSDSDDDEDLSNVDPMEVATLHEMMASNDLGSHQMNELSRSMPSSISSCGSSLPSSISSSIPNSSPLMLDHPSPSSSMLLTPSPSNPTSMMSPASMSPLTPGEVSREILMPPLIGIPNPLMPPRIPVGTNPRDANNPLSVNQLTSQCITSKEESRHTMVRVT